MAKNLFVSYDLHNAPPERYEAVRKAIEKCATRGWAWIQFSLAYVKTDLAANVVHDRVRLVMLPGDKLAVIDSVDAVISPTTPDGFATIQREFLSA